VDAAVAVLITTSSCRTQQPPLDMNDAFVTPITTPSPSCGIAPQPTARGIAPQTALPRAADLQLTWSLSRHHRRLGSARL
jgi:hypothetical protein